MFVLYHQCNWFIWVTFICVMGFFYQEIKSSSIGQTFKINLWKTEALAYFSEVSYQLANL